ncbi:Scr1 family TA system antitoxin-like transcriptional regulator [Kitasatospora sp. NPDC088351]|uniref:Scr1 family TA system antitoxin-like transcriptional regulator n=1 Tax=Kitasatospora sp. NPDC088351 TaxID=3155180 RepID=UPI00343F7EDB
MWETCSAKHASVFSHEGVPMVDGAINDDGNDGVVVPFQRPGPGADAGGSWAMPALLLGARLRTLRGVRKQKEVAETSGFSKSQYSRIEAGEIRLDKPEGIALILKKLGVRPGPDFEQLMQLARDASVKGWVAPYYAANRDAVPSDLMRLIELETRASDLFSVETGVVPGLLQTDGYRRVVTEATVMANQRGMVSHIVKVRGERHERFFERPPRSVFFIKQSALLQEFGSPEIMVEQMEQLLKYVETPQIGVRVIPMKLPLASQVSSLTRLVFNGHQFAVPELIYNEWGGHGFYYRGPLPGEDPEPGFVNLREIIDSTMLTAPGREDSRALIIDALEHHRDG